MERFDVTDLRLLRYGAIPFSLFWVFSLTATFGLYELNTLMLIVEFLLLSFSLMGLMRWQRGNKLTLTKTDLIIRDWVDGAYYLGAPTMQAETSFPVKTIKRIIVGKPKDLQEYARTSNHEALRQQVAFPRDADKEKLAALTLMGILNKDGSVHVTDITPYRQKSVTKLLNKLQARNSDIIDKR